MRGIFVMYILMLLSLTTCTNTPSDSFELAVDINGIKENETVLLYYDILKNDEWCQIIDLPAMFNMSAY